MPFSKFIPLSITSEYNPNKSLINIKLLIKFLKKNKIFTAGLTDTHFIGHIDFYYSLKKVGIRPIIGLKILSKKKILYVYPKDLNGYIQLIEIFNKYFNFSNNIIEMDFLPKLDNTITVYSIDSIKDIKIANENNYWISINSNTKKELINHIIHNKLKALYLENVNIISESDTNLLKSLNKGIQAKSLELTYAKTPGIPSEILNNFKKFTFEISFTIPDYINRLKILGDNFCIRFDSSFLYHSNNETHLFLSSVYKEKFLDYLSKYTSNNIIEHPKLTHYQKHSAIRECAKFLNISPININKLSYGNYNILENQQKKLFYRLSNLLTGMLHYYSYSQHSFSIINNEILKNVPYVKMENKILGFMNEKVYSLSNIILIKPHFFRVLDIFPELKINFNNIEERELLKTFKRCLNSSTTGIFFLESMLSRKIICSIKIRTIKDIAKFVALTMYKIPVFYTQKNKIGILTLKEDLYKLINNLKTDENTKKNILNSIYNSTILNYENSHLYNILLKNLKNKALIKFLSKYAIRFPSIKLTLVYAKIILLSAYAREKYTLDYFLCLIKKDIKNIPRLRRYILFLYNKNKIKIGYNHKNIECYKKDNKIYLCINFNLTLKKIFEKYKDIKQFLPNLDVFKAIKKRIKEINLFVYIMDIKNENDKFTLILTDGNNEIIGILKKNTDVSIGKTYYIYAEIIDISYDITLEIHKIMPFSNYIKVAPICIYIKDGFERMEELFTYLKGLNNGENQIYFRIYKDKSSYLLKSGLKCTLNKNILKTMKSHFKPYIDVKFLAYMN